MKSFRISPRKACELKVSDIGFSWITSLNLIFVSFFLTLFEKVINQQFYPEYWLALCCQVSSRWTCPWDSSVVRKTFNLIALLIGIREGHVIKLNFITFFFLSNIYIIFFYCFDGNIGNSVFWCLEFPACSWAWPL